VLILPKADPVSGTHVISEEGIVVDPEEDSGILEEWNASGIHKKKC
jgi:hypothetical protein